MEAGTIGRAGPISRVKSWQGLAVGCNILAIMEPINQRKLDHINIVSEDRAIDRRQHFFDRIHLTHRALPELTLAEVDPSTRFLARSSPSRC